MRYCSYCGENKPYNPTAKRHSVASGFHMGRCWACFTEYNRARSKLLAPEDRARYSRNWDRKYPAKRLALNRKYELAKQNRVPPWANLERIEAIYQEAATKGLTVDHVIPLRGKLVSGLHVENNLQLLTKSENSKKGNKY